MVLTREEADVRLNSSKNLANRFGARPTVIEFETRTMHRPGKNRPNLTEVEKIEIAVRARSGSEKQSDIAADLGISQPAVSKIASGVTPVNEEEVQPILKTVQDKAIDRLMASMGLMSDDKLSGCSAKDLSAIAANMSRVVEKSMPKEAADKTPTIVIYAPELRNEKSFKVVEI